MKKINIRAAVGILLLVTFLSMPFIQPIKDYISIPNDITIFHNNKETIKLPGVSKVQQTAAQIDNVVKAVDASTFQAVDTGKGNIVYEFANFPIKKVDVDVLNDYKVIPGGQSVGVKLQTLGVLVVGHHLINTKNGEISPGEDADIQVGDVILKINNQAIKKMEEIKPFVNKAGEKGEPLELLIKRGEKKIEKKLTPALDKSEEAYRIGLYIRDSAAGIGTMTFYDPKTKKYGALGHVISDMDTKKPIQIHNGSIVRSSITNIQKGNNGTPGEKQATFERNDEPLGTISKNSPFGVFGKLNNKLQVSKWNKPMPIALSSQVEVGNAQILTVVDGEKVEAFDIEIVNSVEQKNPATKGMIIKITDDELLEKTGGIVQGMSGSPIIQNGKIIGAVTHVFVNDPTSGYGIHIEWMLQEAGIDIYQKQRKAS
ncbi:SpoIVB peptidase precursor [Paraliobacillus sp. PM-2]|uniref:SpoIVB peptidase n=1 Tax=Paraliobacillus sp. PM-2 TaxID=1462524 RepID=UPI00061CCA5F|nr:SpoIVB peptidase [Paraliobacillus sp. PM-2]CQR46777.1 SpoIVB peptidase precursor [Paraliobacillus sp. PM-2]